jgi:hypothetical protein
MPSGQTERDLTAVSLRAEPVCQISQRQQAIGRERAPSGRDHHERIQGHHVGPPGWQREQLPVLVMQVDPVLAPVLAVDDELEVLAAQGMERMRHADASVPITRIRCS